MNIFYVTIRMTAKRSSRLQRYVAKLRNIHEGSQHALKSMHVAGIVYGGNIVSFGNNIMAGKRSAHAELTAMESFLADRGCMGIAKVVRSFWRHPAEELKKIPKNIARMLNKLTLVVVRFDARGDLRMSEPCHHCAAFIKRMGVAKVIYSTDDGHLIQQRVAALRGTHVCQVRKIINTRIGEI